MQMYYVVATKWIFAWTRDDNQSVLTEKKKKTKIFEAVNFRRTFCKMLATKTQKIRRDRHWHIFCF